MKRFLFLAALAFALTACSVSSTNSVVGTETRSGGFMGLSTNDAVQVTTPKAFAGANKVVIGGFKVGFNESKRLQKKASGTFLSSGFGGKSTGLVKLEGISSATKQKIADQAYVDFVAMLKKNGYTVESRSLFTGNKAYSGTKEYKFPYENDNSGMLSSYGVATYYSPAAIGSAQPVFIGEIDGVTGGIGFSNPMNAAAKFGEETGIPVLNVTYFVDFAGAGGHAGVTTSSIEVGQIMSVDKGVIGISSGYSGTFSTKVGSMNLGQPVGSDIAFAQIESATSDAEVGVETAMNVATALLGGGTNQQREFVFKANPEKYSKAAKDALDKAMSMMTKKMSSLR